MYSVPVKIMHLAMRHARHWVIRAEFGNCYGRHVDNYGEVRSEQCTEVVMDVLRRRRSGQA